MKKKAKKQLERAGWTVGNTCDLLKRIGSRQSPVAKFETGVSTVTIDLEAKALLAAGSKPGSVKLDLGGPCGLRRGRRVG